MLMIRFQRIGRKNDPAFRIAVLEKTSGPKAGTYVDLVGSYNPKTKATNVQSDKIKDWVSKGAQISPSVMNLLIKEGVYEGKKFASVSKKNLEKNKAKNEEVAAAAAQAAAEAAAPKAEPVVEAAVESETPTEVEEAPAEFAAEEATPVIEEEAAPAEEVAAAE
jgi:small subunit ribosomal protein S16